MSMPDRDRNAFCEFFRDLWAGFVPPKPRILLRSTVNREPLGVVSAPASAASTIAAKPQSAPTASATPPKLPPADTIASAPIPKEPAAPAVPAPTPVEDAIPEEAINFVAVEEDGSQAYYNTHYQHWDWPEGASGPTIGMGYDCGYVTPAEAKRDWEGYVDEGMLNSILAACGHRGASAAEWVREHHNTVTISYALGMKQFREKVLPTWVATCRHYIPNFDLMPPLMRGALFSLTYNRGPGGFVSNAHDSRNAEMREIVTAARAKKFTEIPDLIASQKRLWPRGGDLWNRRLHEAALATKGLQQAGLLK